MKTLIQVLNPFLFLSKQASIPRVAMPDQRLYCIQTLAKVYLGQVVFQDDVMINLQTQDLKAVKILKSNVRQITVIGSAING